MEMLGSYELTGHLTSQNSGYSVWGFGKKNGKDYFIKQFLSPKYPANDTVSSPERLAKIKKKCARFENKKRALYEQLNIHSDGNAVRIEEFFRVENKYYITMRKIESLEWDVAAIQKLGDKQKRLLCAVIAHAVAGLHKARIVHADLKHDNVLFMRCPSGFVTAKVIDFDSGFLETDPPSDGEEIVGDQVYFSPEACQTFMGMTPPLTCKMDIFALGVLFHQYFAGDLPGFDRTLGSCAGEVVAKGGKAMVREDLTPEIRELLEEMLDADYQKRPTAVEVYARLAGRDAAAVSAEMDAHERAMATPVFTPAPVASTTTTGNPFFKPGDL